MAEWWGEIRPPHPPGIRVKDILVRGQTLVRFIHYSVYKHTRLKKAEKLSILLSTPQAEFLGKYYFIIF